jgi:hypothetical protein
MSSSPKTSTTAPDFATLAATAAMLAASGSTIVHSSNPASLDVDGLAVGPAQMFVPTWW